MAKQEPAEVLAARTLAANAAPVLAQSAAFRGLPVASQQAILGDLDRIRAALTPAPSDPYALSLDTPEDFLARRRVGTDGASPSDGQTQTPAAAAPAGPDTSNAGPRQAATETIAARAGALSDEINFPAFVAGLVHGTFDAIVDATIRQMEAFAELVSAVAKDVDEFTRENVTPNQVRDHLVQQYPAELRLELPSSPDAEPRVRVRAKPAASSEDGEFSPAWLADFGLQGESLTDELVEEKLVPAARRTVGESRLKLLASMVLLGMSRVNVKDGSVSARVRFRAAAKDRAFVNYAVNQDAGGGPASWAQGRGSAAYDQHSTLVSTVGVNVQADSELKAELFGEVRINFVSETLPLERFADAARLQLLQRNARTASEAGAPASPVATAAPAAPVATPPAPTIPAPAAVPATGTPAPAPPAPAPPATPRSAP